MGSGTDDASSFGPFTTEQYKAMAREARGQEAKVMDFDEWWIRRGRYMDTDPGVALVDKLKDMMEMSWAAAKAQSGNYVADTAEAPHEVIFANGRRVVVGSDGALGVGWNDR